MKNNQTSKGKEDTKELMSNLNEVIKDLKNVFQKRDIIISEMKEKIKEFEDKNTKKS